MGQADDARQTWFADQCGQYLPRVLNYVRLRTDGEDLAQDLTAEVFERAVDKQHTLRRPGAFGAWLFAIARTTVAGYYRRHRSVVSLDRVAEVPASDPSPQEAVMRREELSQLIEAMEILPDREREIIRLKFAGGLGNQQIAKVLGLRAGHVAVLLYRALRKLRGHLQGGDDANPEV